MSLQKTWNIALISSSVIFGYQTYNYFSYLDQLTEPVVKGSYEDKRESTNNKNEDTTPKKPSNVLIFPTKFELHEDEGNLERDENKLKIVSDPDSLVVMVNKDRSLPGDFKPKQLIVPNVRFPFEEFAERKQLKAVAALALEELFNEAEIEDHYLYAVSGYRSFSRQEVIFDNNVRQRGIKKAEQVSARPGTSEHQTGLAMDISVHSQDFLLTEEFGRTPEGKWVAKNAHKFGFIIRYPEDKTHITGYVYEPWHLRYVGIENAEFLFENDLTLEEAYEQYLDTSHHS